MGCFDDEPTTVALMDEYIELYNFYIEKRRSVCNDGSPFFVLFII